ncbi:MAG: helix-turn-helix domain-containing protein [Paraclostridium sp.]
MIITDKIIKKMNENEIGVHRMSRDIEIHHSGIYRILNGENKNPRIKTIKKIADYLGMSVDEILE